MTIDTETLDYEAQRLQNIKRAIDNQALLLSLGLASPAAKAVGTGSSKSGAASLAKLAALKRSQASKKKKKVDADAFKPEAEAAEEDDKDEEDDRPAKRRRSVASSETSESSGLRRSSRSSRPVSRLGNETGFDDSASDYSASPASVKGYKRSGDTFREPQREAKKLGVRTENPKRFGHIPGVEVGRCWATRMECSTDAIHAPTVAGISGNPAVGAWSIALSGGYPDDVDLGVAFTYTGCGGRDLKGTKQNPKNLRTAEQTYDQSFDWPLNAAIKRSAQTKKPVRVIRGYKLPSPYAPVEGYRYDGLYVVEKAWMAKGLTKGLKVCRYAFKRMDGQPPLPERDLEKELQDAAAEANDSEDQ